MKAVAISVLKAKVSTALVFLTIVLVINTAMTPFFFTALNLSNVATASIEVGLLALPATLLIVSGELDLSIASTMALCAAVLALTADAGAPWPVALVATMLTGLVAGLVNGILVTQLGLSSIIVTIGTLALYRGIAKVLLGDRTILGLPPEITGWNLKYVGQTYITLSQVFLLVVAVAFAVVLDGSRWGRVIKLIGSAPEVARFSGVGVGRIKIALFGLSGMVSGLAAIFLVSRLQAVRNDIGLGFEIIAITVVLIGGTSTRGGEGTVWGTMIALAVVASVTSGLRLADAPDQVGLSIVGALLIVAIVVARLRERFESTLSRLRSARLTSGPSDGSPHAALNDSADSSAGTSRV